MMSTDGIVRPMVASTEPKKMLTARCISLASAALTAPIDSGVATSSAIRMPPSGGGAPSVSRR